MINPGRNQYERDKLRRDAEKDLEDWTASKIQLPNGATFRRLKPSGWKEQEMHADYWRDWQDA